MRENIGKTVAGLLINDQIVIQTKPVLLKMGQDFTPRAGGYGAMQFDRQRLEQVGGALLKNLATIDRLLDDPRFNAVPQTDDDKALARTKAYLENVTNVQRQMINLIYGVSETYSMEDLNMRTSGLNGAVEKQLDYNPGANGPNEGLFNETVTQFQNGQANGDPRFMIAASDLTNNPFGRFYAYLTALQMDTQKVENIAATDIFANMQSCY